MEKSYAAELLGMPEREIVDFADTDEGTVIRTFDGALVIAVEQPDGPPTVMLLVHPGPGYGGDFPVFRTPAGPVSSWAAAADRERDVLAELGVELADVPARPGSPEALGVVAPSAVDPAGRLQPGEADMQARALVDDAGPGSGLLASAANPDTGARNVADATDATDAGTVVPVDGTAAEVVAWAGDDPVRLRQALDAEQAKDQPRSTLVARLSASLGEPVRAIED
jgi:hypothetical protein